MNDFWNNVSRYPRFFISSLAGSLLVILIPLKTLFKTPRLRGLFFMGLFSVLILTYVTIKSMTGL